VPRGGFMLARPPEKVEAFRPLARSKLEVSFDRKNMSRTQRPGSATISFPVRKRSNRLWARRRRESGRRPHSITQRTGSAPITDEVALQRDCSAIVYHLPRQTVSLPAPSTGRLGDW